MTGNIGERVIKSSAVLLSGRFFLRVVSILATALLARLLTPADYGLIAAALVVVGFADVISDLSVGSALMRLKTVDDEALGAAFLIGLIRGGAIALLIVLFAGPAANIMNEPALMPALSVLAFATFFNGFRNPKLVIFARNIDFSRDFIVSVTSAIGGAICTVAIALLTRDYWALVWGQVTTAILGVIASYAVAPYRPKPTTKGWREFLVFGGWLTAANVLIYASRRVDAAVLTARLGAQSAGQFSMGQRLSEAFTSELASPFAQAIFAGFTAVASDRRRLRGAYYKAQSYVVAIALPIGVGASLCAQELIAILAGPQWADAAFVIAWVAPAMAASMLGSGAHALAMTLGETKAIFTRNVTIAALRIPLTLFAIFSFGFVGGVVARCISELLALVFTMAMASRLLGDGMLYQLTTSLRSLGACALMSLALLLLPVHPPAHTLVAAMISLALKASLGGAIYLTSHWLLWLAAGKPTGVESATFSALRRVGSRLALHLS